MNKLLTSIMYVTFLAVLCSGCVNQESIVSKKDIDWSISKHSDVTGLYYEENTTGFKAAFLTFEDKEFIIDEVENWNGVKGAADTYYTYICSDPDSWEAYIYYAAEGVNASYDSMKFYIEDATIKFFITTSDTTLQRQSSYFLILIQASSRGAWPNNVDVYVDDVPLVNEIINISE